MLILFNDPAKQHENTEYIWHKSSQLRRIPINQHLRCWTGEKIWNICKYYLFYSLIVILFYISFTREEKYLIGKSVFTVWKSLWKMCLIGSIAIVILLCRFKNAELQRGLGRVKISKNLFLNYNCETSCCSFPPKKHN